MAERAIVVDGSNVAYEEQSSSGKPRMANIVSMRRELVERGFEPTIIADATLRHEIDDPEQLEALFDDGTIHQAPAGATADTFVLLTAEDLGCRVVSNDTFTPYRDRHPWIDDRRVPFMIIDGAVHLSLDPPPRE